MHLEVQRRPRSLISLTPLIDVVFILLMFFMLASSFLEWHAIELNTPAETSGGTSMEGAMLVRIGPDGAIDLNGERLALAALGGRVRGALQTNPDQRILVQPESRVVLQTLVTVLDRLKAAGAGNIALTPN